MARNEVKQDLDPALVALVNEPHQVRVGAETAVHTVVVEDVVTTVNPSGFEKRIEPHDSHPEAFDVVEFGKHSRDISDSVSVGVLERRRVNLIDYSILKPLRALLPGLFERTRLRLRE